MTLEQALKGEGLIPLNVAIGYLPAVQVAQVDVAKVCSGGVVEAAAVEGPVRVMAPNGDLLALADVVDGRLKYRRVLQSR